jgi:hypothetical protein
LEWKYSLCSILTATLDGSGQFRAVVALLPCEEPLVHIGLEVGWYPDPVWTLWRRDKVFRPYRELNHSHSSRGLVTILSELSRFQYTRAVCKFHGFNLLLRVRTLLRCGDGLFFEVLPLASDALLTTLHPLLENLLQTVDHFEISCLEAPFSWLEKPRNRMERDLN